MKAKEYWKPVTIGSTVGILLGPGTMFAIQHGSDNGDEEWDEEETDNDTESIDVSIEYASRPSINIVPISDDMSFSEAFAAGRAAAGGPGGVFSWRGNLYGTYYKDEWDAMSHEEKHLFAVKANTAARPADSIAQDDVSIADDATIQTEENEFSAEDEDVRIIGFGDVDLPNGQTVTIQELEVNGQRVALIDVDQDGEPDIAMSDLNHNQQMDEGEVIDLQTGEAVMFTNSEEQHIEDANEDLMSMTI